MIYKEVVLNFKEWINENVDYVQQAILTVVGGTHDVPTDPQIIHHLLNRNTAEFDSKIKQELKELGIVKALDDKQYQVAVQSIDNGIPIKELIDQIELRTQAPYAKQKI